MPWGKPYQTPLLSGRADLNYHPYLDVSAASDSACLVPWEVPEKEDHTDLRPHQRSNYIDHPKLTRLAGGQSSRTVRSTAGNLARYDGITWPERQARAPTQNILFSFSFFLGIITNINFFSSFFIACYWWESLVCHSITSRSYEAFKSLKCTSN